MEVAEAETARVRARYRRSWYWWLVVGVYCVAAPALAVAVSAHNTAESARAWCKIIVTLDDAYRLTPPSTPVGVKLAEAMRQIRAEYDC